AEALNNRSNVLLALKRHEDAAATFARLVAAAPDYDYALGRWFHAQLHCCDWSGHADAASRIVDAVRRGRRAILPFSFLDVTASPAAQLDCARIVAADRYPAGAEPLSSGAAYGHERIRLAYVSADFRDHPVPVLIAGVLESHDKARFELTAIALNPEEDSDMG